MSEGQIIVRGALFFASLVITTASSIYAWSNIGLNGAILFVLGGVSCALWTTAFSLRSQPAL